MRKILKDVVPTPAINVYRKIKRRKRYLEIVNDLPENVIVSYPKCGRTWLRAIINSSFYFQFPQFAEEGFDQDVKSLMHLSTLDNTFPPLQMTHDGKPMYHHHGELYKYKREYYDRNVLLLTREPKDTLISWYFHLTERDQKNKISKENLDLSSIYAFLMNEYGGIKTYIQFYNLWLAELKKMKSHKVVRYEDIRKDPVEQVVEIFRFFGVESIGHEAIKQAVDKNELQKMKNRERQNLYNSDVIGVKNEQTSNENAFKVRRGKIGGFKDYLSTQEIEAIDSIIKKNLNHEFGY